MSSNTQLNIPLGTPWTPDGTLPPGPTWASRRLLKILLRPKRMCPYGVCPLDTFSDLERAASSAWISTYDSRRDQGFIWRDSAEIIYGRSETHERMRDLLHPIALNMSYLTLVSKMVTLTLWSLPHVPMLLGLPLGSLARSLNTCNQRTSNTFLKGVIVFLCTVHTYLPVNNCTIYLILHQHYSPSSELSMGAGCSRSIAYSTKIELPDVAWPMPQSTWSHWHTAKKANEAFKMSTWVIHCLTQWRSASCSLQLTLAWLIHARSLRTTPSSKDMVLCFVMPWRGLHLSAINHSVEA